MVASLTLEPGGLRGGEGDSDSYPSLSPSEALGRGSKCPFPTNVPPVDFFRVPRSRWAP